jgi:hypothetical protein
MYRAVLVVVAIVSVLACSAPSYTSRPPPLARAAADTTWLDQPSPVMTMETLEQLMELWAERSYPGACLRGAVTEYEGVGRVAEVTHVQPAIHPSRCPAKGYVGAVLFFDAEQARLAEASDVTCRMLTEHPEWGVVGAVSGLTYTILRDPEGEVVGEGPAPVASFCGWTRDAPTIVTAASTS